LAFTTIPGSGAAATTIVGTSGVDFGTITALDNYFVGAQQGADTIGIASNLTAGTIKGGSGNDTISFTAGASISKSFVNSNANNDLIGVAGAAANFFTSTVLGGAGNDTLTLGAVSASTTNGNKGNDNFAAGATATSSTLFGGQGNDTVNATAAATGSTISGDIGNDQITLGAGVHNTNSVSGGAGNDAITLTAGAAGTTFNNNTISGGAGADNIVGNVVMAASTGTVVNGDAGIDTINFGAFTQAVTLNGGTDGDIITAGVGADTVKGDAGNDSITNAAGGADNITGGTGVDQITLGAGFENISTATGDSVAATAGFSNATVNNNVTVTFANGADQVLTAMATNGAAATSDQFRTGIAGVNELVATNTVGTLAAGNYAVNGAYAAGTGIFTINDTGADLLFFQTNGGDMTTAASIGTMSTVFIGSGAGGGGTDIAGTANNRAAVFIV
jgi:Ca2+-binding RTX toxin-like protein